ncbi:MAG: DDE-type integrase/transposase/recombinase [Phycisphaeraceae bacterium]
MNQQLLQHEGARRGRVLGHLGIATSSWHHRPVVPDARRRPGPALRPVPAWIERGVLAIARANPWHGYKKIAVMCRRHGHAISDRQCHRVMKQHDLLQRPMPRAAELYQAKKLWELLPKAPNDLWQMDVTYIHIPGHGWWYAVTVIDYYSRYLLALHFTSSYSAAEVTAALGQARQEAERIHGPLGRPPFLVTDNGSSFIARRFGAFVAGDYAHVRIAYRTPTQLGLLERFHRTLKSEEVYWNLYANPAEARESLAKFRERYNTRRPHWALRPVSEDEAFPGRVGDVLARLSRNDPLTPQDVYEHGRAVTLPKWQPWAKRAKEQLDQMMLQDAA